MECLLDYTKEEMIEKLLPLDIKGYRVGQIFDALMQGKTFSEMTTISAEMKQKLMKNFVSQPITILQQLVSKDGTIKFLYKLADDNIIEGVLMKYKYGNTICVSTQVGCRMGYKFCASTLGGLVRNLTAGEILGQVVAVNKFLGGKLGENRQITNIVLMGSGEPLDNYENVTKFFKLVCGEGLNISERNISLSTCGIVEKIKQLADDDFKITLTISLHSPTDEQRKELMPIAYKYSLKQIVDASRYYFHKTGRRVMFEYVLVKGKNDSFQDARMLRELLKGFPTHINVIPLNSVKERDLKGDTRAEAQRFVKTLTKLGQSATLRRTLGEDIEGACGQLRRKYLDQNSNID